VVVAAALPLSASLIRAQQMLGQSPPADGAPAIDPSRSARHLLRNGLDYLDSYRDCDRALTYLREAERRQAELGETDRKVLKQAIERARRGLREVDGMASSANRPRAGSLTPHRTGAIALAPTAPDPASAPEPTAPSPASEPDPIQLVGGGAVAPPMPPPGPPPTAPEPAPPPGPGPAPIPPPPPIDPTPSAPVFGAGLTRPTPTPADPGASLPPLPVEPTTPAPEPAPAATNGSPAQLAEPAPVVAPAAAPIAPPAPAPAAPAEPPTPKVEAPPTLDAAPAPVVDPAPAPAAPVEAAITEPSPTTSARGERVVRDPEPVVRTSAPAPSSPSAVAEAPEPVSPPTVAPAPSAAMVPEPIPTPTPVSRQPRPVAPAIRPAAVAAEPATLPPLPGERPVEGTSRLLAQAMPTRSTTSGLPEDLRREVEEVARRQDEAAANRRQPERALPPTTPTPESEMGTTSSRLLLPRPPSPTEARPLRPIPVPEEFVPLTPRQWNPTRKYWAAAATCHSTLYFQDAVLERYGQSVEQAAGPVGRFMSYPLDDPKESNARNQILQPVYSAALFAAQIATLPYHLVVDPPWEAEYDLGYYRPGDRIPPDTYYLPLRGVGPPLRGRRY
jgi:hypothetical protein